MKIRNKLTPVAEYKHSRLHRITLFILGCIIISLISCADDPDVLPKLKTLDASETDITSTTAKLKGEILSVGNVNITGYGIELSESAYFTSPVNKGFTGVPSTGVFEVEFTGLKANTRYYFKSYALVNTANVYPNGYLDFTTKP